MISKSDEKPLACWRGKDRLGPEILDSLTIIFKTGGCSWNKCRMCSYRHERFGDGTPASLAALVRDQLNWVLAHHPVETYQMVKIFTSGSFFDPNEVPPAVVDEVAAAFKGKVIVAETRAEYVDGDRINRFVAAIDDGTYTIPLYIAIGLETTSDQISDKSINKGSTFAQFKEASKTARKNRAGIKAYLLMKPLFLTEQEAIDDMIRSIEEVSPYADLISMNPCNVQSRTEVEQYWKQGAYRPPYLWSVLKVLDAVDRHVLCDPVGGGRSRGPHNCGACDHDVITAINEYALTGDRELIRAAAAMDCACKEEWEFVCSHEQSHCMPLTR